MHMHMQRCFAIDSQRKVAAASERLLENHGYILCYGSMHVDSSSLVAATTYRMITCTHPMRVS